MKENAQQLAIFRTHAIGRPIDYVRRLLDLYGWSVRVVKNDGQNCIGTCDLRQNRVNVEARDGKVVDVLSIG